MLKLTAATLPLRRGEATSSADSRAVHRQRLLAHDVPAGGQDLLDLREVHAVGRRDVNDVDAVVVEQLVEAGVGPRDAERGGPFTAALRG